MLYEDVADIRRKIAEEVAHVSVLGHAAARKLRLEPVLGTAAVGVDETTDELGGVGVGELSLPVFKPDRPKVFASGAVLGEGLANAGMRETDDVGSSG